MNLNIEEVTIRELHNLMESGRLTAKELVMLYMERIAKYDKDGPKLNSIIEINQDAIFIAEALDNERQTKGSRGYLHGIPIIIKDNINTNDKMHTSAGSLALADNYAPYDAFVAKKLREAGAVILGKANMTEFANYMAENMPNGYSSRGGQVLNPYKAGADTGGSSSGSGVSVSANLCAAAIGTETSGSILSPCNENGIVGIKPTVGLISRTGIIPIAFSQDTAGPMARTVEDAAILLGSLTGVDENDAATGKSCGKTYTDYTQFLDKCGLKGCRIGIPVDDFMAEVTEEMLKILDIFENEGATLIKSIKIPAAEGLNSWNVLKYEFKADMNSYLASLGSGAPQKSLTEIIEFNNNHSDETLKYGQKYLVEGQKTAGTLTESEYLLERIRDLRLSQTEGIDKVMEENQLDALLFFGYNGADIAARAGYPSIIVPAGFKSTGIPFGVTFTAKAFSEPVLIKIAYAFEQATKLRRAPEL